MHLAILLVWRKSTVVRTFYLTYPQVIGLPSPSAGRRSLIYEFDTAETRFVRVDTTSVPLEVTADGDNVLLPVPPEFAQQCLDVAAAEQGGQQ